MLSIGDFDQEGLDLIFFRKAVSRILYQLRLFLSIYFTKFLVYVFVKLKMHKHLDPIFQKLGNIYGLSLSYEILDASPVRDIRKLMERPIGNFGQFKQLLESEQILEAPQLRLAADIQDKTALVIQGALGRDYLGLFNIIKLYLERYPLINIVISIWDYDLQKIQPWIHKHERIFLVISEDPVNPGISNINRQIVSTLSGIEKAHSLGKKYTIKIRTDQFLLGPKALEILSMYSEMFIDETASNPRILGVSRNTFKYRYYTFSDMFQFGLTDSLLSYWNIDLDSRTQADFRDVDLTDLISFSKANLVESYLQVNYMLRCGLEPKYTLEDSLRVYSDLFIIIDESEIGLTWTKYSNNKKSWASISIPNKFEELSASEWLFLHKTHQESTF